MISLSILLAYNNFPLLGIKFKIGSIIWIEYFSHLLDIKPSIEIILPIDLSSLCLGMNSSAYLNAEHVKIDIKYELPVLIVGKNEIVFSASDGGLQTCFVSTFGKSDEKKSNLQDFFNGEKSKIQLGESNKMIISSL